jgi:hypothetical protein
MSVSPKSFSLGGWLRLWIVLVVIYGAVISTLTWRQLPETAQIQWEEGHIKLLSDRSLLILAGRSQSKSNSRGAAISKVDEARAAGYSDDEIKAYYLSKGWELPQELKSAATPVTTAPWSFEMPNRHVFEVPANTTKNEATEVAHDYMRVLEKLRLERRKVVLTDSLIVWIVPSTLALALGWSVGWILRGFRKHD